ncbi:31899_t:CDS:1, partial [Gigaspora margarita]
TTNNSINSINNTLAPSNIIDFINSEFDIINHTNDTNEEVID